MNNQPHTNPFDWGTVIFVFSLLGLVCLAAWAYKKNLQRYYADQLRAREALTPGQFISAYYPEATDKNEIFHMYEVMANILGVEPGRLRPTDKLDEELDPPYLIGRFRLTNSQWLLTFFMNGIYRDLKRRKTPMSRVGITQGETLDDMVRYFMKVCKYS